MTDWLEQYSTALDVRDAREQAHKPYIDAYTRLADRMAAMTTPSAIPSTDLPSSPPHGSSKTSKTSSSPNNPAAAAAATASGSGSSGTSNELLRLRQDLIQTQKARQALESELALQRQELTTQQRQAERAAAETARMRAQNAQLERRVRDRTEEAREKGQVAGRAQDEMVALQLQLNMAEQRSERLEGENRELVRRWMQRKGEEVEEMNRGSGW